MKILKDFDRFGEQMILNMKADQEARKETLQLLNHYRTELRQSAIEWIKELESPYLVITNGLAPTDAFFKKFELDDTSALIFWIKHFFNISSEELGETNDKNL
jgi:hypothetical protein